MTHTAPSPEHSVPPSRRPAVVVGVDGSERNHAAIDWAAAEAVRAGRELRLVAVASVAATPAQSWSYEVTRQYAVEEMSTVAERMRRRILPAWDRTVVDVRCGSPVHGLLDAVVPGDVLVLGRRGTGAVQRAVVGSTSIAVAGRSSVPTIIVPSTWDRAELRGARVVAGVNGTERDVAVLEFAFRRAHELSVSLLLVEAWETERLYAVEGLDLSPWREEVEHRLAERLARWTVRYPGVDLAQEAPTTSASQALLDSAEDAQLVVVGRRAVATPLLGFSGFSTCRQVLHHLTCPVAVVPVASVDLDLPAFDERDDRDLS
jgi:nucleotide-binding universal stress UspA family protein